MDAMAIDVNPEAFPANTTSSLGSQEVCIRINENNILDADEDVVDGLFVDVTADTIPPFNNGGTPGDPSDDSGGIVGFSYTFSYDETNLTIQAHNNLGVLYRNPGGIPGDGSDPTPDVNNDNVWNGADLDTIDPNPESGSGFLHRLTITSDPGAVSGNFPLTLTDPAHIDASGAIYAPDAVFSASVSVNEPPCGGNDGDFDGVPDVFDNCVGVFNPMQENADGDARGDACDNCPSVQNNNQANFDADSMGDVCDPDDDNDGSPDTSDLDDDNDEVRDTDEANCGGATPSSLRPERVDGAFDNVDDDGDTLTDEALPGGATGFDCDGDGYKGSAEDHVTSYLLQTDGDQKTCQEYDTTFPGGAPHIRPSKRWPSDIAGVTAFSLNKINIQDLSSFVSPIRYLNQDVGTDPMDVRFDLVPGSTVGADINVADLAAITNGLPPMLGGLKAFGGPVCPYAP